MGTPDLKHRMDTDMKSQSTDAESVVDLTLYRKLVRTYIDMRRYKTALFWAEKVVALGQHDAKDVYWMAQCMFLLREYHRAAHVIRARGLERTNLYCLYLAAESLFEAKDCQQAIELLNCIDADNASASTAAPLLLLQADSDGDSSGAGRAELLSTIWLLKGKVLEAMDNRSLAMDAYVQALQHSVYCTEALDALVQHEMLMAWEEQELMANLPFAQQCTEAETKVLQLLYGSKLKKYYESNCPLTNAEQTPNIKVLTEKLKSEHNEELKCNRAGKPRASKLFSPNRRFTILSPANKLLQDLRTTPNYSIQSSLSRTSFSQLGDSVKSTPTVVPPSKSADNSGAAAAAAASAAEIPLALPLVCRQLEQSVDLMVARAEKLFYNCEYKKCMQLLDECFHADPYHAAALTLQIGCLVELRESNKLFYLAHNLIDLYPDQAISWYAVGCYYDLNNKSDPARRYLAKATSLDRLFGPAWLAYGHSFAKENEHDQAMAAYFKATQLMRGCHLPLLYIGVECGLTKNHELAEKFFYQAMSIAPLDVFVLHELGVIKFECEDYQSAEDILRATLDIVAKLARQQVECLSPRWEPLLNNLGHCCRKNGKFPEALQFHQRALAMKPLSASTYTAIGFVQSLMGRPDAAIESLHRSLSIKRDDIFASTLLRYCIEDLIDEDVLPGGGQMSEDNSDEGGATNVRSAAAAAARTAGGSTTATLGGSTSTMTGASSTMSSASSSSELVMLTDGPAVAMATADGNDDAIRKLKFDDSMVSPVSGTLDSSLDMSM